MTGRDPVFGADAVFTTALPAGGEPQAAPNRVAARRTRVVEVMGTVISLDVRTAAPIAVVNELFDAAAKVLVVIDQEFSTYEPGSSISRLNRGDLDPADLPGNVKEVLRLCEQVGHQTDQWFTPRWRGNGTVDPTGLVKGWAAEQVSDLFLARGFPDHCVNAAGDIVLSGSPTDGLRWRVGIADPRTVGGLLGFVDGSSVRSESHFGRAGRRWAVATSGVTERGRHVLDPRSGAPATGSLSATVIGRHCGVTDGYATAVVAAGGSAELMQTLNGLGCPTLVVAEDGSVRDPFGYLNSLPW